MLKLLQLRFHEMLEYIVSDIQIVKKTESLNRIPLHHCVKNKLTFEKFTTILGPEFQINR